MNNKKSSAMNILFLIVGEILVSLLVVGMYILCDLIFESDFWEFSYKVITGALLGSLVTVLNYLFLIISLDRAVDKFLALRGNKEMSDEEAMEFTSKNAMRIQNVIKTSFLVRTLSIVVTLVIAFVLDWFAPLATVIPLLAFRPILMVVELIRKKLTKAPDLSAMLSAITYNENEIGSVATDITDEENAAPLDPTNETEKESDE